MPEFFSVPIVPKLEGIGAFLPVFAPVVHKNGTTGTPPIISSPEKCWNLLFVRKFSLYLQCYIELYEASRTDILDFGQDVCSFVF